MIIRDKKGAALLEKSLKFGYCLMVEHGELRLMGEDWLLTGYVTELGREMLGVLVKHLGKMPVDCCCRIFKHKEEYLVQEMLPETFHGEAGGYMGDSMEGCRYTGLRYGRPLYQLEDQRILAAAVRPELLNCSATNAMACGGSSLAWMDDDSTIYFRAYRPGGDSEQKVLWDALESVRWGG